MMLLRLCVSIVRGCSHGIHGWANAIALPNCNQDGPGIAHSSYCFIAPEKPKRFEEYQKNQPAHGPAFRSMMQRASGESTTKPLVACLQFQHFVLHEEGNFCNYCKCTKWVPYIYNRTTRYQLSGRTVPEEAPRLPCFPNADTID
jgi:hypothetical protein